MHEGIAMRNSSLVSAKSARFAMPTTYSPNHSATKRAYAHFWSEAPWSVIG